MAGFSGADNASARNTLFPPDDPSQIWRSDNPVGTETVQSLGMPQPTVYAGPVGQFVDPNTGQLTTQGQARMADNPLLGFDTGGIGGVLKGFHGSPHAFDRFSTTRRSARARARRLTATGMYLADSEGVARSYRDALHRPGQSLVSGGGDELQRRALQLRRFTSGACRIAVTETASRECPDGRARPHVRGQRQPPSRSISWIGTHRSVDNIRWSRTPIQNTRRTSRSAIRAKALCMDGRENQADRSIASTGSRTSSSSNWPRGGAHGHPAVAAGACRMHGVPGIRYLDAGSRGAGEGSRNTVVSSIRPTMDIVRRYGLAGLMAGGGAAALGGQGEGTKQ